MKNKFKKLIPYCLILIMLVGLFSPIFGVAKVRAQDTGAPQRWQYEFTILNPDSGLVDYHVSKPFEGFDECDTARKADEKEGAKITKPCGPSEATPGLTPNKTTSQSAFEEEIGCSKLGNSSASKCFVLIAYYAFYMLPRFLLGMTASLFNLMAAYTLSSDLYGTFIAKSWTIVRDLSNIFFILILLYIAIKMILGLGGAEVKKMIVNVIIVALLINFSMFFTQVVIDSSNILALIFYNKLSTQVVNKEGKKVEINYIPLLDGTKGPKDKDIAGALTNNIDPTNNLDEKFFKKYKATETSFSVVQGTVAGTGCMIAGGYLGSCIAPGIGTAIGAGIGAIVGYFIGGTTIAQDVPAGIMIGIIVTSGAVMAFAAYAFFIAAFAFLGRLVELWMLILFSPFAFMSFSMPQLKSIDYLGWDSWIKRLLTVGFMAPIFMFFLYLIVLIIQSKPLENLVSLKYEDQNWIQVLMLLILPMSIIIIMLLKAVKFAKKGSGEIGEAVIKGGTAIAGLAGGLAIGGGIGLAASTLQGSVGHAGKAIFESTKMQDWATKGNWAQRRFATRARALAGGDDGKGGLAGSSFDLRKGVAGGALGLISKTTGLNLGAQSKFLLKESGGYEADLQRRDQRRLRIAEGLKAKEGEPEKQALNKAQELHQSLMLRKVLDNGEDGSGEEMTVEQRLAKIKTRTDDQEKTVQQADAKYKVTNDPDDKEDAVVKRAKLEKLQGEKRGLLTGEIATKDPTTGMITFGTTNGGMTEKMANSVTNDETDAMQAASNNKNDVGLANAAEIAKALADAARAAQAVTAAEKATAKAMENPKDDALKMAANIAENEKEARMLIANNSAQNISTLAKLNPNDTNIENGLRAVNALAANATKGLGHSIKEMVENVIPDATGAYNRKSKERQRGYANAMEKQANHWWRFLNRAELKKSAHEIRMGAAPEKPQGGGGHGVGLIEHAVIEGLGQALSGHGHDNQGGGGTKKT